MTLRFGTIVMMTTAALALAAAGCGGGGGSGSGGGNGNGGAGGGAPQDVNGCSASGAKDETASSNVTVTFGSSLTYSPACIKIKKGSKVTFSGDFTLHPLQAGTVDTSEMMHPDASSPIKETNTGMSKAFTFSDSGTFGYYCENHFSVGMKGAVVVE
jgi:plastocyanin